MEEVPDEEMPNGDDSITTEDDDQWNIFQFICGGQSWDRNLPKITQPVEELVPKEYHEYLSVFQKKELENAFEEAVGSWY